MQILLICDMIRNLWLIMAIYCIYLKSVSVWTDSSYNTCPHIKMCENWMFVKLISKERQRPFGKLGIGISASALASASAFEYKCSLSHSINRL